MDEMFIPIVLFIAMAVVLCLFFMYRYKTRSEMQATIRTAIDKGQELTPEVIDRLGTPKPPKDKDLRTSLIWFALGVSSVAFGFAVPEDNGEALRVFVGMSAFPFSLGVAYLAMWKYSSK